MANQIRLYIVDKIAHINWGIFQCHRERNVKIKRELMGETIQRVLKPNDSARRLEEEQVHKVRGQS